MDRRTFLKSTLMGGLALGLPRQSHAAEKPPNVLFIMTDDQGPWAWGNGHPNALTPNIDTLRREGVHLSNYFVTCPVCSPARGSMLTSRYPTEFGFTDWLKPDEEPPIGLDPALPAWPRQFQNAGYRTAHIGKWHLGREDKNLPQRFGYDYFAGWRHGAFTSKDPMVEIDGVERKMKGYTPDILTDLALDFISNDQDAPFLLSLHFWAPHANTANRSPEGDRTWLPMSDADWDGFKDLSPTLPSPSHPDLDVPRAERMTREYLASVHSADRNIGRILKALEQKGLSEDTIVVFTSDHGYNMAHHGIWHKGNGRWLLKNNQGNRPNLWETSVRAPAIIRWPGKIDAGSSITNTTSCLDWFPSLLSMAGLTAPEDAIIHGQDFAPLLQGTPVQWNNDFLLQYDQHKTTEASANLRGYRTPNWKLIRDFRNPDQDEFYNLKADPGELNNLIDAKAPGIQQQIKGLDKKMRAAMRRVGDIELLSTTRHNKRPKD